MLGLFLTLLSCTALKLADPVSLRDVNEENVSLQSWCVGVGCVMPFTPATCLSWCDWNFDKQSDAEARGAFRSELYGVKNQVKASEFNMIFAAANCADNKVLERFMDPKLPIGTGGTYGKNHIPIFPQGDKEAKSGDTYLKCKHCYIVQGPSKDDKVPGRAQFSVSFTAGNNGGSKMTLFQHDNKDQCGTGATELYHIQLPEFTKGKIVEGKWVSTGGACANMKFVEADKLKKLTAAVAACQKIKDAAYLKVKDEANAGTKKNAEDAADKAYTKCVKDNGTAKFGDGSTQMGFGLTNNLAWPTCA